MPINNNYNAKWDENKIFSKSGRYVPGHSPWLNEQMDMSDLTEASDASGLFAHILHPEKRYRGKKTLNPTPTFKNLIAEKDLKELMADVQEIARLQAKQRAFCSKHHRKLESDEKLIDVSKSAKAGRFCVVQGNLNPNHANNAQALDAWFKCVKKAVLEVYPQATGFSMHLNEVSPGIHFFIPAFVKKVGPKGVYYEFDKTHNMTGKKGMARLLTMHKKLADVSQFIAKSFGLDFRREPVSEKGQNRKVEQFRRIDEKLETSQPLSKKETRALNRYVQGLVNNAVLKEQAKNKQSTTKVKYVDRVVEKVVEKRVPVSGGKFDAWKVETWDRVFDVLSKTKGIPESIKEAFVADQKVILSGGDDALMEWLSKRLSEDKQFQQAIAKAATSQTVKKTGQDKKRTL